jgi:nucleotide-binding universal stress UspA family protein
MAGFPRSLTEDQIMRVFRTIVCAADFSERSKAAFRVACSLAKEDETRLFVLHVMEQRPVVEQEIAFGEHGALIPLPATAETHHEALKQRLREVYVSDRPVEVDYGVCEGVAANEVLCKANELKADLIVLGTHGRTGLHRLLTGSVAESVLRHAECPVLALKMPSAGDASDNLDVILHPTDFSERADPAMWVARDLARDRGARLVVLGVAPLGYPMADFGVVPVDAGPFIVSLEKLRQQLDGPDLKYPVEVRLKQGDPAGEIARVAKEIHSTMIVMGSHGRSGLGRLLVGSVAEACLREAGCPVLVVKAGAAESTADSPHSKDSATV